MGDRSRPDRLSRLRELEVRGTLTEPERAELARLVEERCRDEAAALEQATRRTDERAAALSQEIERVEAQNRELVTLLREQEAYLADVETLVARMEERRRQWRERCRQVTGRPIEEPITAQGGG
jgi:chromosome segregation ATPase